MKDWNIVNVNAAPKNGTTEGSAASTERAVSGRWNTGFPSLSLRSLSPLSTPLGEK